MSPFPAPHLSSHPLTLVLVALLSCCSILPHLCCCQPEGPGSKPACCALCVAGRRRARILRQERCLTLSLPPFPLSPYLLSSLSLLSVVCLHPAHPALSAPLSLSYRYLMWSLDLHPLTLFLCTRSPCLPLPSCRHALSRLRSRARDDRKGNLRYHRNGRRAFEQPNDFARCQFCSSVSRPPSPPLLSLSPASEVSLSTHTLSLSFCAVSLTISIPGAFRYSRFALQIYIYLQIYISFQYLRMCRSQDMWMASAIHKAHNLKPQGRPSLCPLILSLSLSFFFSVFLFSSLSVSLSSKKLSILSFIFRLRHSLSLSLSPVSCSCCLYVSVITYLISPLHPSLTSPQWSPRSVY